MLITISPGETPPFEQVRQQIAEAVADGSLPVGTRLPTVRRLAMDLGVAAGTVARAYRELEAAGVLVTRGRHGTFVGAVSALPDGAGAALAQAVSFVRAVRELGLGDGEIVEVVRQALIADAVRPG